ncbi:MAG: hypothetical protein ACXWPM_03600 [Bdellovibrionota bacterium]
MRLRGQRILLLLLFWGVGLASLARAQTPDCAARYLAAALQRVYLESYKSGGLCLFNSVCLAETATREFGERIRTEDLHVLIIKHKEGRIFGKLSRTKEAEAFWDRHILAVATRTGKQKLWAYHAVLEYHGRIYDFDFREPIALPAKEYFEEMFPERRVFDRDGWGKPPKPKLYSPQDLSVQSIPASEAISKVGILDPNLASDVDFDFIADYPELPLGTYIKQEESLAPARFSPPAGAPKAAH